MPKHAFDKGTTSVILKGFVPDSSLTTGLGLSGLDQTSGITGGYVERDGTGVALVCDENVTTEGTYEAPSAVGKVRIGTVANMPAGWYEFHFHDDLFATADWTSIGLVGAADMPTLNFEVDLTGKVDIAKAVHDRALTAATHNIPTSAGRRLRQLTDAIIHSGTATGGAATYIDLDAGASAVDNMYDPGVITIVLGAGLGQSRQIWEYDGTLRRAYVNRDWKVLPDATSQFILTADAGNTHVNEGKAGGGGASTITLNALASTDDNVYRDQAVFIAAGTGQDQSRRVSSYDGGTKVATVDPAWQVQPDATSIYAMLPLSNTSELQAEWADGGRLDLILDAIEADTDQMNLGIVVSTTKAGTLSTTQCSSNLTETTTDHYKGRIITWTSGVLDGQSTDITAYSGTNGVLTYTLVTEAPGAGDAFKIT